MSDWDNSLEGYGKKLETDEEEYSYVVFGIVLTNATVAYKSKRCLSVIMIGVVFAFFSTLARVLHAVFSSDVGLGVAFAILTLLFALCVPYCSYHGFKKKDRTKILGFFALSGALGLVNIVVFGTLTNLASTNKKNCAGHEECERSVEQGPSAALVIGIVLTLFAALAQILSFWWGKELYDDKYFSVQVTPTEILPSSTDAVVP